MLIIFDLDDTLIDTSGAVTPFKMKECLKLLVREGLPIQNFDRSYQELLAINAKSPKSKDALSRFIEREGGDLRLLEPALEEMTKPLPDDFVIPTTPHAKEILEWASRSHTLALVTGGHPPFQREKLKKAGIEPAFFSKIDIPEDSVKKPCYQGLLKEFSIPPQQVIVCGDRIAMDLAPAHELGIQTVHMRWGRGAQGQTEAWIRHAISDLTELKRIVR